MSISRLREFNRVQELTILSYAVVLVIHTLASPKMSTTDTAVVRSFSIGITSAQQPSNHHIPINRLTDVNSTTILNLPANVVPPGDAADDHGNTENTLENVTMGNPLNTGFVSDLSVPKSANQTITNITSRARETGTNALDLHQLGTVHRMDVRSSRSNPQKALTARVDWKTNSKLF